MTKVLQILVTGALLALVTFDGSVDVQYQPPLGLRLCWQPPLDHIAICLEIKLVAIKQ